MTGRLNIFSLLSIPPFRLACSQDLHSASYPNNHCYSQFSSGLPGLVYYKINRTSFKRQNKFVAEYHLLVCQLCSSRFIGDTAVTLVLKLFSTMMMRGWISLISQTKWFAMGLAPLREFVLSCQNIKQHAQVFRRLSKETLFERISTCDVSFIAWWTWYIAPVPRSFCTQIKARIDPLTWYSPD